MKQLLKENSGKESSTRWIFLIGMIWSMFMSSLFTFIFEWGAGEFIAVFTSTSTVFIGLKLGQKPMEQKNKKPVN